MKTQNRTNLAGLAEVHHWDDVGPGRWASECYTWLASVAILILWSLSGHVLAHDLTKEKGPFNYTLYLNDSQQVIGTAQGRSATVLFGDAEEDTRDRYPGHYAQFGEEGVGWTAEFSHCEETHGEKHEIGCLVEGQRVIGSEPDGTPIWTPENMNTRYTYSYELANFRPCDQPECCQADPCNISTGAQIEKETDYRSADGLLDLTRVYRSINIVMGTTHVSSFGAGWSGPIGKSLDIQGSTIFAVRPNGTRVRFTQNAATGLWAADPGIQTRLTANVDYYYYWPTQGGLEAYNITTGRLAYEVSANHLYTTYAYSSSPQKVTVTGPHGRELIYWYGYSGIYGGGINKVTLPDDSEITYEYNGVNLVRVNYPDGTARKYFYENPALPSHLTGIAIVNSGGVETRFSTISYDDQTGQALFSQWPETDNGAPQMKFVFSYDNDYQVTVTDPANNQKVITLDASPSIGAKRVQSEIYLADGKGVMKKYDDATNKLICNQDAEDRITTYTYNASNQRDSMTVGQGGTCDAPTAIPNITRTTTYEYKSPNLDLKTFVRRPSVSGGANQFEVETQYNDSAHYWLPTDIIQRGFRPDGTALPERNINIQYPPFPPGPPGIRLRIGKPSQIDGPRLPTDVSDITVLTYYNDSTCTTGGACGQLKDVTNAKGHITQYNEYYADGRLKKMTDPNDLVTAFTYSPRGRVASITQTPPVASGLPARVTIYTYTAFGEVETVTTPDGIVLDYDYDAAHYLRSITDNLGNRIEYDYDLRGNRTAERVRDPGGLLVRNVIKGYDLRNRLDSINNDGALTTVVNDAVGNRVQTTDPNNNAPGHPNPVSTISTPDALNRLTQVQDTLTGLTDYDYDVHDRLTQVTAPNNAGTTYEYDDLGNLLKEISPDRGTTVYTHDEAGNVLSRTDARGIVTNYTYDALNRLLTVSYPASPSENITYTYDQYADASACPYGTGRLCEVSDESGTTKYEYDPFGNIVTEIRTNTGQAPVTTYYTYDAGNRIASTTLPSGRALTYTRDGLGRLTSVKEGATAFIDQIQYRADGLVTGATFGNGLTLDQDYNLRGELLTSSTFDLTAIDGDWNNNGALDAGDVVLAERTVLGTYTPTLTQRVRGDVYPQGNPDGQITLQDLLILIRAVHGLAVIGGGA